MTAESHSETVPIPPRAGVMTFAVIFSLESLVRSLNSTVISLQAYEILGSSQKVSMLATSVSLTVLLTTLFLPALLGRLRRRWAYTLGAALMALSALMLATHTLAGQWLGMFLRNNGAAIFNIALSLYILDNIRRQDLTRAEPIRLSLSTFSWMAGPALGVWLLIHFGPWGAQLAVLASLALLMGAFWYVRLIDRSGALPEGTLQPFRPLANVRRFVEQPRLRLAWLIAFGRSVFWTTFFIYAPILVVEGGLGKGVSGLVISASQALLLAAYFSGAASRLWGIRAVISCSFVLCALASLGAGIAGTGAPYAAITFLLLGSLAASALDGVGGIPFLRSVRHFERQRMTAVYRTFLDFSELIPAFLFSLALMWLPLGSVFIILAAGLLTVGALSWRFLPRSM